MFIRSMRRERGQAIVLMVIGLIGLLGFAAVALDGGNIYSEQRRAQAAADSAVLAAAYKQMEGVTSTVSLSTTALANAALNDFSNDQTTNWVTYYRPPIHGAYVGNSGYMEVVITRIVPTALAHLVYRGPWQLTVSAVAHGASANPMMDGYAVAAMNPGVCNGNDFTARGGTASIIRDGGVYVNAYCEDGDTSINMNGSGARLATSNSADCPDPLVPPEEPGGCIVTGEFPINTPGYVNGTNTTPCTSAPDWWSNPGDSCNFYPEPNTIYDGIEPVPQDPLAATLPSEEVDQICNALPAPAVPGTDPVTVSEGRYNDLNVGNRQLVLNSGIYCITGYGGSNGVLEADSIIGQNVFIYIMQQAAEFKFAGNGFLDLTPLGPADCATDDKYCPVVNIVIYKPYGNNTCGSNDQEIEFKGNSLMTIFGLIYAPQSYVSYGGNGDLVMTGQSIVGCVRYAGNGDLDVIYTPDLTYIPPPRVSLDK